MLDEMTMKECSAIDGTNCIIDLSYLADSEFRYVDFVICMNPRLSNIQKLNTKYILTGTKLTSLHNKIHSYIVSENLLIRFKKGNLPCHSSLKAHPDSPLVTHGFATCDLWGIRMGFRDSEGIFFPLSLIASHYTH